MAAKKKKTQKRLKDEAKSVGSHFKVETLTLLSAGFGLVAALAWNEAIKGLVDAYIKPYFGAGGGVISLFVYAVFITLLVVVLSYYINKFKEK